MRRARQQFAVPLAISIRDRIAEAWCGLRGQMQDLSGKRVAVGVGSRGIANLPEIVAEVVNRLRSIGALPFVTPAMGSHGGATAQGQLQVLARLGITAERLGVPVLAEMEVVQLDEADGIPLFQNRLVSQADGFVLINRVKPHTDFCGPIESGIIKMLVIGLGNQKGADLYHRLALKRGFYEILITAGRALLEKTRFLFGVAVVENQHHEICDLDLLTADRLEKAEARLLTIAKDCLPRLPLDEIDLLVVDQMGKNFSGAGLDPNVVGTTSCKWGWKQAKPVIRRIFVRQLSA
jgi:hypothetical protein